VWVARRLGLTVSEVMLWVDGGMTMMEPERGWRQQVTVALGGPSVNVGIGVVMGFGWWLMRLTGMQEVGQTFWVGMWMSVVLVAFNLLPLWPLDGGHVLMAVAQHVVGMGRGRQICGTWGILIATVAMIGGMGRRDPVMFVLAIGLLWMNIELGEKGSRRLRAERKYGFMERGRCPYCDGRALAEPSGWCAKCEARCNLFDGACWNCGHTEGKVWCWTGCGAWSDVREWLERDAERGELWRTRGAVRGTEQAEEAKGRVNGSWRERYLMRVRGPGDLS
jgi:hypothetical protein